MKSWIIPLLLGISLVSCRERRMVSDSMYPTLKDGEVFNTDYTAYMGSDPERWDVVIYEGGNGSDWCHRVVGLPGDTIAIVDGQVVINGKVEPFPAKMANIKYDEPTVPLKVSFPIAIPPDHYFIMGDNSTQAEDSRFIGTVHRDRISAKVHDK